jgi:hypothetical protein
LVEFVENSRKICRFDGGVCFLDCCSWIDVVSGKVVLCVRHGNANGCFKRRGGC